MEKNTKILWVSLLIIVLLTVAVMSYSAQYSNSVNQSPFIDRVKDTWTSIWLGNTFGDLYKITGHGTVIKFIGSTLPTNILTKVDLPIMLSDSEFLDGNGILVKSTPVLKIGARQIQNSTSNGDLDEPTVLVEVGTDPNNYLYEYKTIFSSSLNITSMSSPSAGTLRILGEDYKVQEGSTSTKIILQRIIPGQGEANRTIILEDNQSVRINNTIIRGTHVEVFDLINGAISRFSIKMALQNPDKDYVAVGESYVNPTFKKLEFYFQSYGANRGANIYVGGKP